MASRLIESDHQEPRARVDITYETVGAMARAGVGLIVSAPGNFLSPNEARALADALVSAAREVDRRTAPTRRPR